MPGRSRRADSPRSASDGDVKAAVIGDWLVVAPAPPLQVEHAELGDVLGAGVQAGEAELMTSS